MTVAKPQTTSSDRRASPVRLGQAGGEGTSVLGIGHADQEGPVAEGAHRLPPARTGSRGRGSSHADVRLGQRPAHRRR